MALPVSLTVFIGLATMKVPSAVPQMITDFPRLHEHVQMPAHGHEAAEQCRLP